MSVSHKKSTKSSKRTDGKANPFLCILCLFVAIPPVRSEISLTFVVAAITIEFDYVAFPFT
jgi:hypothetical protein